MIDDKDVLNKGTTPQMGLIFGQYLNTNVVGRNARRSEPGEG